MPIPPRPFTLICQYCSWKKTILPSNDVPVLQRDWITNCPNCHNPSLERRNATHKEALKTRLEQFLDLDGGIFNSATQAVVPLGKMIKKLRRSLL